MPETIKWNASELTGVTGMKAWLYGQLSGTLLNTGGDDLTETGSSSGLFSFSLAEARTGLGNLRAVIKSSGGVTYRDGILREDATLVEDLDLSSIIETVDALSGVVAVTVSGYGVLDPDGTLQLKQGQTGAITFTSDTANIVPDLSVANTKVFLSVRKVSGQYMVQIEGTVITATGLQVVSFSPTAAEALLWQPGKHLFDVMCLYGYDANSTPPYTSAQVFTGGTCEVTRLEFEP